MPVLKGNGKSKGKGKGKQEKGKKGGWFNGKGFNNYYNYRSPRMGVGKARTASTSIIGILGETIIIIQMRAEGIGNQIGMVDSR